MTNNRHKYQTRMLRAEWAIERVEHLIGEHKFDLALEYLAHDGGSAVRDYYGASTVETLIETINIEKAKYQ